MGTKTKMTLLSAIEQVVEAAEDSGLSEEFMEKVKRPVGYICRKLPMNRIQAVLFALFVDRSDNHRIKIGDLAGYVKCRNVRIMKYMNEIDALERSHYLRCIRGKENTSYRVPQAVVSALKNDKPFVPQTYENITATAFFCVLHEILERRDDDEISTEALSEEIEMLMEDNPQLEFVRQVRKMQLCEDDRLLLMKFCDLYVEDDDNDVRFYEIDDLYDSRLDFSNIKEELKRGTNQLQEDGIIEYNTDEGYVNSESFRLTDKAKKSLLAELNIQRNKNNQKHLTQYTSLAAKQLFYNDAEAQQIERLTSLLMPDSFNAIRQRLQEKGMRQGFACLFYGSPGTGKTETVYQLARQTHRNLMQVNVSDIKSKWVGDSEKNIQQLFDDYRQLVAQSDVAPILLFNEADAVIGRRREGADSAVEKMENAIQNIILQEMERLDGILIATTNLTGNLDRAFERRFLYKIEFHRPSTEAMKHIWQAMLPELSAEDAAQLSQAYDLSGGQIENISCKHIVDTILSGSQVTLEKLQTYCREELSFSHKGTHRIGFV